jgi:ferrochelatase
MVMNRNATTTREFSTSGIVRPPKPAASMPASALHAAAATALVLVNLGTPGAPTAPAVRRYLAEFLSDPRVVPLPRLLWQPLLRGVVLPRRAPKVAARYAQIWMDAGSPLAVHTRALAETVQRALPEAQVVPAMRYGEPALAATLQALRAQGARRALLLPLYPQYSTTTTASVADLVARADVLPTRLVADYHDAPEWLAALADSVRAHWAAQGCGEHLLLSFHGIPQRLVDAGDPYAAQCTASARALAQALGLDAAAYTVAFQSRFGRARWLRPYTPDVLHALAARGVRRLDVLCPGFAVDCLETLEEIALRGAAEFRAAGGDALRYIPCLNAAPAHAQALAAVARRALEAWA